MSPEFPFLSPPCSKTSQWSFLQPKARVSSLSPYFSAHSSRIAPRVLCECCRHGRTTPASPPVLFPLGCSAGMTQVTWETLLSLRLRSTKLRPMLALAVLPLPSLEMPEPPRLWLRPSSDSTPFFSACPLPVIHGHLHVRTVSEFQAHTHFHPNVSYVSFPPRAQCAPD